MIISILSKNKILLYCGLSGILYTAIVLGASAAISIAFFYFAFGYVIIFIFLIGFFQVIFAIVSPRLNSYLQIGLSAIPYLLLIVSIYSQVTPYDKYLIPKGYTGHILINRGIESGQEKQYENGYRVFRIPKNGYLKTQFDIKNGLRISSSKYLYTDSSGHRTTIPYLMAYDSIPKDSNSVYVIYNTSLKIGYQHHQIILLDTVGKFIKNQYKRDNSIEGFKKLIDSIESKAK